MRATQKLVEMYVYEVVIKENLEDLVIQVIELQMPISVCVRDRFLIPS